MKSIEHEQQPYLPYWGKADDEGDHHPLIYHSLDVAACGEALLEGHQPLRHVLASRIGLSESETCGLLTFFLSQHDIGKFSPRFQAIRPDVFETLQPRREQRLGNIRHDSLGWHLWQERLSDPLAQRIFDTSTPTRRQRQILHVWMRTVTGHHGQPPLEQSQLGHGFRLRDHFDDTDIRAAATFIDDCYELFLSTRTPTLSDSKTFVQDLTTLSWWLAGAAVLCDWLGSNSDLFRYCAEPMPVETYWNEYALPQARRAIRHSGVLPLTINEKNQSALFHYLKKPTPLQHLATEIPVSRSPQLLILEDVTGAGKTEAALSLAHRITATGGADGLFIALPTMATSNAMYRRILDNDLQHKLFDAEPSLLLTHSAAQLVTGSEQRDRILPEAPPEANYGRDDLSAANQRSSWLKDHRKKALLADFGVGTIDQALLSILPSRHQSLRLLGLMRKVLIVDEVHACDAYMLTLLKSLLTFHASIGGHVILLSATLPQHTRQSLADAFRSGLGAAPIMSTKQDYPLLTRIDGQSEGVMEVAVETRPEVAREVRVESISDKATVIERLLASHRQGQCACWVRNSVADAMESYGELLDAGLPPDQLELFHARFALGDRLAIEQRVLKGFGPDSGPETRRGRILIATQVVEQSLDLDFDLMVTDLAPIDLIIQRAGRLQRHTRDRDGRRANKDERGVPTLVVLTPEPTKDVGKDWLDDLLRNTAYVYPDLGQLWRTAHLLQARGGFRMPEDARKLIEGVFGDAGEDLPTAIAQVANDQIGKIQGEASIAKFNALDPSKGYKNSTGEFWDDITTPTRLGDPNTRVRLARWNGTALTPWFSEHRFSWSMSEVGVRSYWFNDEAQIDDPALAKEIEDYRETVFDKGRWSRLLVLQETGDGYWEGEAVGDNGETVHFRYDPKRGLSSLTNETPQKVGNGTSAVDTTGSPRSCAGTLR